MLVHAGACTGRALTRVHVCDTRTGNVLPLSWVRSCKTRTGQALPRVRVCDVYTGHTLPLSCVCTCGARTGHALPYQPCSFLRDTNCLSAVFVHAEHTQATHCPVFVHVKTCTGHVLLSAVFVHVKHAQATLFPWSYMRCMYRPRLAYQLCSCMQSIHRHPGPVSCVYAGAASGTRRLHTDYRLCSYM